MSERYRRRHGDDHVMLTVGMFIAQVDDPSSEVEGSASMRDPAMVNAVMRRDRADLLIAEIEALVASATGSEFSISDEETKR